MRAHLKSLWLLVAIGSALSFVSFEIPALAEANGRSVQRVAHDRDRPAPPTTPPRPEPLQSSFSCVQERSNRYNRCNDACAQVWGAEPRELCRERCDREHDRCRDRC